MKVISLSSQLFVSSMHTLFDGSEVMVPVSGMLYFRPIAWSNTFISKLFMDEKFLVGGEEGCGRRLGRGGSVAGG